MSRFNYFIETDISTTDFSNHMFSFGFVSSTIILMNESTTLSEVIEYSFDGVTLHGNLTPTKTNAFITFNDRHESKIWFRLKTASAPVFIRVEAWG